MAYTYCTSRDVPSGLLICVICVNCVVGVTCFQSFFSCLEMQPLLKHFCVYHVSAPGQRDNAPLIYFG